MRKSYTFFCGCVIVAILAGSTVYAQTDEQKPQNMSEYEKQLREKNEAAKKLAREKTEIGQKLALEEIQRLHNTANNTTSSDPRNIKDFVLSTELRTFRDIPEYVDNEIVAIREGIRSLIYTVATDIEMSDGVNSGTITLDPDGINYSPGAVETYQNLMEAKTKNNVSVRSVQIAIQMLASINNQLMQQAKSETNGKLKRKLYITQAAYIYEMADIVLNILNEVQLEGKPVLDQIQREHENRIQTRMSEIQGELTRIEREQQNGKISEEEASNLKNSYKLMVEANQTSLQAWGSLMEKVNSQEDWLNGMKSRSTSVELVRNAAKHQLDTLRDIVVVSEMTDLFQSIDELVAAIGKITLLELTNEEVQIMLFPNKLSPEKL